MQAFKEFDAALPSDLTEAWTKLVTEWEEDRSRFNLFMIPSHSKSLYPIWHSSILIKNIAVTDTEIRLRLAEEDNDELNNGTSEIVHEAVSASMLVWQGLDLEEQQ